ncbi:MAG: signal peptidase I [Cellulosilyticum sp.]|nr:signal peptidase I [Cellulosilyticum sp.]
MLIKELIEKLKEPILAILAALLISCFIISHTQVPTESMMPMINPGDHLIVNRLPFYYRDPMREEIVVFEQGSKHLIKRVIGVPGDVIDLVDGHVYINGSLLDESDYLEKGQVTFPFSKSSIIFPYTVPEGYYFVLGDNRRNSSDSRVFGPIARTSIIAKAGYRIFPIQSIGMVK